MAIDSIKIKMFWCNDIHFRDNVPKDGEKYIPCYKDHYVKQDVEPNAIALIREPRPLIPKVYEYLEKNYGKFKYVFTHDSELLKVPNAKPIIWAGVWKCPCYRCTFCDYPKEPQTWGIEKDFDHPISIVIPEKTQVPLKALRKEIALELQDRIDCFGFNNGSGWTPCRDYLEKYPYQIVMENHIDDLWFTEKICNCFANNTVPIYMGSKKITDFFNGDGIIQVDTKEDIISAVDYILEHGKEDYNKRLTAMADNKERAKKYVSFEKWFLNEYGEMLGELL